LISVTHFSSDKKANTVRQQTCLYASADSDAFSRVTSPLCCCIRKPLQWRQNTRGSLANDLQSSHLQKNEKQNNCFKII
jgi:hypothetical protein